MVFQSVPIAQILGITVRVHLIAILAVVGFVVSLLAHDVQSAWAILWRLGMMILLVLAHELGHSLAARRRGVVVVDITLWPLGGLARLAGMPRKPAVEFEIAAAGPVVNLIMAIASSPWALSYGWPDATLLTAGDGFAAWISFFCVINWMMGLLNLVPAFPLDGGRMLRAMMARHVGWENATLTTAWMGRVVAMASVVIMFYWRDPMRSWPILLVALFIDRACAAELRNLRATTASEARPDDSPSDSVEVESSPADSPPPKAE